MSEQEPTIEVDEKRLHALFLVASTARQSYKVLAEIGYSPNDDAVAIARRGIVIGMLGGALDVLAEVEAK